MDTSKLYQTDSKFLKAENLVTKDGRYVEMKLLISDAAVEKLQDDDGAERVQLSIGFDGKQKRMLLNKTNYQVLAAAWGTESDNWTGKEVVLYVDPYVRFKDKVVPGLRIKPAPQPGDEPHDLPF